MEYLRCFHKFYNFIHLIVADFELDERFLFIHFTSMRQSTNDGYNSIPFSVEITDIIQIFKLWFSSRPLFFILITSNFWKWIFDWMMDCYICAFPTVGILLIETPLWRIHTNSCSFGLISWKKWSWWPSIFQCYTRCIYVA